MTDRLRAELDRIIDAGAPAADHATTALGDGPMMERLESAIRALAEHRGPDSSTCPSDAARAVGGADWRDLMSDARDLARALAKSGEVHITQRGEIVDPDSAWRGPIRIRTTTEGPAERE
ncbi:MAG: DUF3253 domain-containing protein [Mycobacterium sp.]